MQLRKLYKTIEAIASQPFESEEELLKRVLHAVVDNSEINIKGGRAWKFDPRSGSYVLMYQTGDIETIKKNYHIKLRDYPIFTELPKMRTVLASEQNPYLRERGILKYSATGIGETITWRGKPLYKYVLAFNADKLDDTLAFTLNIISTALTSVLRGKQAERETQLLERDLDKAREIQKSILPQHEMRFDKYELYGVSLPARIVGGDFFDYLQIEGDTERLGVVIGDAASKGLSAAAQALYLSGALRMGFEYQTKISSLLARINKLLNKTFSEEQFVTLFYGELTDDRNGLVLYANCGHNSPIIYRATTGSTHYIEATGQILGPFPDEKFHTENILMNKGDILVLYTDGISETLNAQGEFYGEERIARRIQEIHHLTPKEITLQLLEDVQFFSASDELADDKTIVTIKRTG
jgi:sigma-B regulation protein RsbU (phosphoserine phosphatase)